MNLLIFILVMNLLIFCGSSHPKLTQLLVAKLCQIERCFLIRRSTEDLTIACFIFLSFLITWPCPLLFDIFVFFPVCSGVKARDT